MYIGNTPTTQSFTPQVDFFSGNASTTAFTLSRPVASTYQMIVVVANVTQNPGSAYTVNGNTITFASAPPSGTNNIWVEYTSLITQVSVPPGSYQVAGPVFVGSTIGYTDVNILQTFASNVNNYNQIILQNLSSGTSASTNFNVSNNNATATTNYGEFGINSSGFSGTGSFSQPGYTYLASASTDLAIGTYGNNPIHFVVNSGATDAAIIDVNGNFGLGVTPSAWASGYRAFDISSVGAVTSGSTFFTFYNNLYSSNSGLVYKTTGYATVYRQGQDNGQHAWFVAPSGTAGASASVTQAMTLANSGYLTLQTTDSAGNTVTLLGDGSTAGYAIATNWNTGASYLDFRLGGTTTSYTKVRIDNSGNLDIGVTSPLSGTAGNAVGLSVVASTAQFGIFPNGDGAIFSSFGSSKTIGMCAGNVGNYAGGSNQAWMKFTPGSSGSIIAQVNTNGVQVAINASAWSSYSDPRLKNVTGTYTQPLVDIAQIKAIKFTWKSDTTNTPQVGVDASTVQTVIPEAVHEDILAGQTEDQTKYLSVRYTELIPLMIASIQELSAQVTALQAKVA